MVDSHFCGHMAEERLKHKAVKGVLWRMGETGGRSLMQFVVSAILARLIMPDQFGMIAMLGIFLSVSNVFIDSGFADALIRKNNRTQADCSTVYWFNVIISIVCYIIIFISAPLASRFYGMPQLTTLLRVMSVTIVIVSFSGVHRTLLTADMKFNALTKYNLFATFISAVVGVGMALLDFQVWALVGQSITSAVVRTISVWMKVKWRPSFIISKDSLKEFFSFGSKMLASSLLNTVYSNIYSIVIGKIYKAAELAYYNRAYSLLEIGSTTPTTVLQSVTYPTLCKLQDDSEALKNGYRRILKLCCFITFPMCVGMGAVAFPLITVIYTDVWIYSATLLSIVAFASMWFPMHAINLNLLIVKGRSDLFFRLEVIKKIQGVIILCVTLPFGLEAMCYGSVASSLLCLVWNTYYTGKFLHMTILHQIRDLIPTLILCGVMYAGARTTAHLLGNDLISLISSIAVGVAIYMGGALIFKFPEVRELKNLKK